MLEARQNLDLFFQQLDWTNNCNSCVYELAFASNAFLARATGTTERTHLLPHWKIWIGVDQNLKIEEQRSWAVIA